jgi:hypothetical protein
LGGPVVAQTHGTTVLDPGPSPAARLHIYAHCLCGTEGGVALLVVNGDRGASPSLDLPIAAERYTLTAESLTGTSVQLNGSELRLGSQDQLPSLLGTPILAGRVNFEPVSITFLAIANAHNLACHERG